MNGIIDIGNTKTKIFAFNKNTLVKKHSFFNEEEKDIIQTIKSFSFDKGIISSSANISDAILKTTHYFLQMNHLLNLPIKLNYKTPETLGTDRIALAVGAASLYPNKNCLIISAGTCITIDIIDKNNTYQGGIISAGLTIRLQSLHTFTNKLPLLNLQKEGKFPTIGKTTKESMESGIYNGAFAEINATIEYFKTNFEDLTVLLTGGDMKMFELNIKNKIFAEQNLQALGLNRILNYNAA